MKYTSLLIDADDTILDFQSAERQAFTMAFSELGLAADEDTYNIYTAVNLSLWKAYERGEIKKDLIRTRRFELLFEKMGSNSDPEKAAQAYVNALSTRGQLIDGAREFLRWASERFDLYAATNGIKSVQEGRFTQADINKFFNGVFISEAIGFGKPDKRYFDYVLSHINEKDPSRVVVIGDSLTSDIRGANNAGLDSIWFSVKGESQPDAAKPTYTVKNYEEIKILLS